MEIDKTTCWYNESNCKVALGYASKLGLDNVAYPYVLNGLVSLAIENDKKLNVLDIGCGSAALQTMDIIKNNFEYCGVDMPLTIDNISNVMYPNANYIKCDIVEETDLGFIGFYDLVIMNAVIDVMQHPIEVLAKILSFAKKDVIIHRQRITYKNTFVEKHPSYGGETFCSIINEDDFRAVVWDNSFEIVKKEITRKKQGSYLCSFLLRKQGQRKDIALSSSPWIPPEAIKYLCGTINKNTKVLEFGCGGSTLWFGERAESVVSIEHYKPYYTAVKKIIEEHKGYSNVDLRLLNRPYCGVCNEFPNEYFDIILVDGRDRAKCVEAAIRTLKSKGVLFIDNSERPYYEGAYKLLRKWGEETIFPTYNEITGKKNEWQTSCWVKP